MGLADTDYATLDEFRAFLGIPDLQDDDTLELALSTASRAIDHAAGRAFGIDDPAVTRDFDVVRGRLQYVTDIATTDDMVASLDGKPLEEGIHFVMRPRNAELAGRPYTHMAFTSSPIGNDLVITAKFGWPEVPPAIKQATLLQASRFWKRKESPYGVAGSPEFGNEMRLLEKVDPDVALIVQPYKRRWAAV